MIAFSSCRSCSQFNRRAAVQIRLLKIFPLTQPCKRKTNREFSAVSAVFFLQIRLVRFKIDDKKTGMN